MSAEEWLLRLDTAIPVDQFAARSHSARSVPVSDRKRPSSEHSKLSHHP